MNSKLGARARETCMIIDDGPCEKARGETSDAKGAHHARFYCCYSVELMGSVREPGKRRWHTKVWRRQGVRVFLLEARWESALSTRRLKSESVRGDIE